jgi:hypothetical protein
MRRDLQKAGSMRKWNLQKEVGPEINKDRYSQKFYNPSSPPLNLRGGKVGLMKGVTYG